MVYNKKRGKKEHYIIKIYFTILFITDVKQGHKCENVKK